MKKTLTVIIAAVLCVLMALPFAMMTSADTLDLTEPTYTGTNVVYVSFDNNSKEGIDNPTASPNGGSSPTQTLKVNSSAAWNDPLTTGSLKDGGKVVIVGKTMFGEDVTIPATTNPLVFTSKYNGVDYASYKDDGITYNPEKGSGGQFGAFMITGGKTVTLAGNVIFDDVYLLNRAPESYGPGIIKVTGKLVVNANVGFATLEGHIHNLEVAEGGVAFLHTLGFDAYTGTGTIVVGDEIKATVIEADFAGFSGAIVDKNGDPVFASETTTAAADTTTAAADTTTTAADTTTTVAGDTTTAAPDTTAAPESTTAPAKVEVPAKPTAPDNKIYVSFNNNTAAGVSSVTASAEGGATAAAPYKAGNLAGWTTLLEGGLKDGGKVVIVGKAYFGADYTIPATTKPIVFTSVDGDTSYVSKNEDGTYNLINKNDATGGQYGMFMICENGKTLTIDGEVIFDNTVILTRIAEGKTTSTIAVNGKMVVTNTVQFAQSNVKENYNLVVNEGGYAYLDALGFQSFAGKGTIVVGDSIKNTVKASDFAGFEGYIVDSEGNHLFVDNTPAGGNTNTGDSAVFVAIIALSAVACGAVLTMKKSRV